MKVINVLSENERRQKSIDAVDKIIKRYKKNNLDYDEDEFDTPLSDLLTDMMHYADSKDIIWGAVVQRAESYFYEEKEGD